jgi:hypothetical protein
MSDARRFTATLLLAGVASVASLGAQSPQSMDAVRERVRRLTEALRVADAAANRADSLARAARIIKSEPVNAGALHVLAPTVAATSAQAGAEDAWAVLQRTFGSEANTLDTMVFVVQLPRSAAVTAAPSHAWRFVGENSAPDLSNRLVFEASRLLSIRLGLANWSGGIFVPERRPQRLLAATYVELVTAPSRATQRCYGGDLAGCRDALNLPPSPDVVRRWYGPAERRGIVRQIITGEETQVVPDLYQRCVVAGDDSACVLLLSRAPEIAIPRPLELPTRAAFVQLALELGGPQAFHRLVAADGRSVDVQLETAAGVPLDSLLSVWRMRVLAARPRPVTLEPKGAWLALMWGVVFGVLALRSTRWR